MSTFWLGLYFEKKKENSSLSFRLSSVKGNYGGSRSMVWNQTDLYSSPCSFRSWVILDKLIRTYQPQFLLQQNWIRILFCSHVVISIRDTVQREYVSQNLAPRKCLALSMYLQPSPQVTKGWCFTNKKTALAKSVKCDKPWTLFPTLSLFKAQGFLPLFIIKISPQERMWHWSFAFHC